MAIQTGQRTTANSSATKKDAAAKKRSEASKKAARTRKKNAKKEAEQSTPKPGTPGKPSKGSKVERPDNPFVEEKVEVYGLLAADIERRENRAPAAAPEKTVSVGNDGVFSVDGLAKGSYLAYGVDTNNWLAFQVV